MRLALALLLLLITAGAPIDDDDAPPGGVVLRQTLFAASGREASFTEVNAVASATANTAAGTHDGIATTYDGIEVDASDGIAFGELSVIYTIDTATQTRIAFVRVVARCYTAFGNGFAEFSALQAEAGFANPTQSSPQELFDIIGFPGVDLVYVFPVDPLDGLPWTTTKINARKWGMHVFGGLEFSESESIRVTEYRVEVWG